MRFRDAGPRLVPEFFKHPVSQVPEKDARCFVGIVSQLAFNLRINAASNDENIWISIVVEIGNSGAPTYEPGLNPDFCGPGPVIEIAFTVVAVNAASVAHEVRLEYIQVSVEIVVSDADAHSPLVPALVAQCDTTNYAFFSERSVMVIHEKQTGRRITRHEDVGPSVFVKICCDDRHSITFGGAGNPSFFTDVSEGAVSIVPIQQVASGGQPARTAVYRDSLPVARRTIAGYRSLFQIESDVIGYEQIKVSIAVVVNEATSGTPTRPRIYHPRRFGDVGESTIAVIPIETILSEVGTENVFETIVIVITDAYPVRPSGCMQAGTLGRVGESTIPIVFVESICGRSRCTLQSGSTQQEDVHPSVIVVVKKSAAAAIRFQDVLLRFHSSIDRGLVQSGRLGYIHEMGIEGTSGTRRTSLRLHTSRGNALLLAEGNKVARNQ